MTQDTNTITADLEVLLDMEHQERLLIMKQARRAYTGGSRLRSEILRKSAQRSLAIDIGLDT